MKGYAPTAPVVVSTAPATVAECGHADCHVCPRVPAPAPTTPPANVRAWLIDYFGRPSARVAAKVHALR